METRPQESKAGVRDRLGDFFAEKTARRALLVILFATGVFLGKGLLVFFLFFAGFSTLFEAEVRILRQRFPGIARRLATSIVATATVTAAGLLAWAWGGALLQMVLSGAREIPAIFAEVEQIPAIQRMLSWWPGDNLREILAKNTSLGIAWAAGLGRAVVFMVIGAIVAAVYSSERQEKPPEKSPEILATIARWWGYAFDGVALMIRTQLLVSLINAVLTLPILLVLGIPRAGALTMLVFAAGMVPVLGNILSGAVICLVAYVTAGIDGVLAVIILTTVLHKIESYYINPKIASRHVKLTNTGIILSLLVWEKLAGIPGFFVSLPFLYVCQQIRQEWQIEDVAGTDSRKPAPEAVLPQN